MLVDAKPAVARKYQVLSYITVATWIAIFDSGFYYAVFYWAPYYAPPGQRIPKEAIRLPDQLATLAILYLAVAVVVWWFYGRGNVRFKGVMLTTLAFSLATAVTGGFVPYCILWVLEKLGKAIDRMGLFGILLCFIAMLVALFGSASRCPRCLRWFAEVTVGWEELDRSDELVWKTVTDVHYDKRDRYAGKTERRIPVRTTVTTYVHDVRCRYCGHEWTVQRRFES